MQSQLEKGKQKLLNILLMDYPNIKLIGEYCGYREKALFLDIEHNITCELFPRVFFEHKGKNDFSRITVAPKHKKNGNKNKTKTINIANFITTHPEKAIYIKDAHLYKEPIPISQEIEMVCPYCHNIKKVKASYLSSRFVYQEKYICPFCSDGISRPNKILREILIYTNPENKQFEFSPDWSGSYRYDATFTLKGINYVCEIDGKQHYTQNCFNYNGKGITLEQQKKIDSEKDFLAEKNNFVMIRIQAPNKLTEIKENILKSKLSEIFDLSGLNWNEIFQKVQTSLVIEVWDYYNKNPKVTVKKISEEFLLSEPTIRRYMNMAKVCGYCDYDGQRQLNENLKKASISNQKKIKITNIYTNDIVIIDSIKDTTKWIKNNLDCNLKESTLSDYITKRFIRKEQIYNGYKFEYFIDN